MSEWKDKSKRTVESMKPAWFKNINNKKTAKHDKRTMNECCFDSGVCAAAEFVRRMTGDEDLALTVFDISVMSRSKAPTAEDDT